MAEDGKNIQAGEGRTLPPIKVQIKPPPVKPPKQGKE
jgi:hypothetical protein